MTVAVLGTGQMGTALSRALARAGEPLLVGSRDLKRAEAQAAHLRGETPQAQLGAATYAQAVTTSRIVILAVAYEHARDLLPELGRLLAGKIVVDPTTPWDGLVPRTSGALELQKLLPADASLVAAWKTTFAGELSTARRGEWHDVLFCGDDVAAKAAVAELIMATGFRPLDCGGLEHAGTLEGMTRLMGPIVRQLRLPAGTVPAFHLATFLPPARDPGSSSVS